MSEHFGKAELTAALNTLGREVVGPVELILGGAGALILTGELSRTTSDCDVLFASPDIGRLQSPIRSVAQQLRLTGGWLNGSIQSYLDVLPADFRNRLRSLPPYGRVRISVLHRNDVILMKLYAGRPQDIQDVQQLAPTPDELQFVRAQLPRLHGLDPIRAARMTALVEDLAHDR